MTEFEMYIIKRDIPSFFVDSPYIVLQYSIMMDFLARIYLLLDARGHFFPIDYNEN